MLNRLMRNKPAQGLWLTDFDGTIKPPDGPVAEADLQALKRLGELGWCRVVATGRSLYAFAKIWNPDLEFDALIFSSGIGLCAWGAGGPGPLLSASTMSQAEAECALTAAEKLNLGFFAFQAPPDNHHFYFHRPLNPPRGFEERLKIYPHQAHMWPIGAFKNGPPQDISQLLIMVPAKMADKVEAEFKAMTAETPLSVGRSTSPFNDNCLWLEIYPPGISKGRVAASLAENLKIGHSKTVALGNDYNDLDMLDWAGQAYIAQDAPPDLLQRYKRHMPKAGQGGLAYVLEELKDFI